MAWVATELQNICFEYVKNNFESIAKHLKTIDTHHGRLMMMIKFQTIGYETRFDV